MKVKAVAGLDAIVGRVHLDFRHQRDSAEPNIDECDEDFWDFARVTLENPVNAYYAPSRMVVTQEQWDSLMLLGSTVALVGFGRDENGVMGIKREVETIITNFSSTGLESEAGGMGLDSCQGDSGWPEFV